jgi:integrase
LAVDQPKAAKPEIGIWNAEEARQFLRAARGERLEALYVVALDTGMRLGELFGLHWPQVDFGGGAVFVVQALEETQGVFRLKEPKSKAGRRRIALAPATMAALHDHRKRMLVDGVDVKKGPVFVDTRGGFLRRGTLHANSFARITKRSGVPEIGFHGLRHTSATLLLLHGINVKAVSVRLGHASVQITLDTYGHFLPEMDTQTVAVVEKILFGPDCPTIVPQEPSADSVQSS